MIKQIKKVEVYLLYEKAPMLASVWKNCKAKRAAKEGIHK
jgi:hypothetical protein